MVRIAAMNDELQKPEKVNVTALKNIVSGAYVASQKIDSFGRHEVVVDGAGNPDMYMLDAYMDLLNFDYVGEIETGIHKYRKTLNHRETENNPAQTLVRTVEETELAFFFNGNTVRVGVNTVSYEPSTEQVTARVHVLPGRREVPGELEVGDELSVTASVDADSACVHHERLSQYFEVGTIWDLREKTL